MRSSDEAALDRSAADVDDAETTNEAVPVSSSSMYGISMKSILDIDDLAPFGSVPGVEDEEDRLQAGFD